MYWNSFIKKSENYFLFLKKALSDSCLLVEFESMAKAYYWWEKGWGFTEVFPLWFVCSSQSIIDRIRIASIINQ